MCLLAEDCEWAEALTPTSSYPPPRPRPPPRPLPPLCEPPWRPPLRWPPRPWLPPVPVGRLDPVWAKAGVTFRVRTAGATQAAVLTNDLRDFPLLRSVGFFMKILSPHTCIFCRALVQSFSLGNLDCHILQNCHAIVRQHWDLAPTIICAWSCNSFAQKRS